MAFKTITRTTLESLTQSHRVPGVVPGYVPQIGGPDGIAQVTADVPGVADEFIRALAFVQVEERNFAHQQQVRCSTETLELIDFTASRFGADTGTTWDSGKAVDFGSELEILKARFKRVSVVVRMDPLMVAGTPDEDVLVVQTRLATTAVVRALSQAMMVSNPTSDDNAELAGLPFFLAPAVATQEIAYSTTRKLMGGLAELRTRVAPSDGDFGAGPDCFVMSSRSRWRLLKELEDKGVEPSFKQSDLTGGLHLHYHGVPVLTGRVPEQSSTPSKTWAWALKLRGPSAVRMLHIGGESANFGVRAEDIGPMPQISAGVLQEFTRGVKVFGIYSLLVPETRSIARLKDIPSINAFDAAWG